MSEHLSAVLPFVGLSCCRIGRVATISASSRVDSTTTGLRTALHTIARPIVGIAVFEPFVKVEHAGRIRSIAGRRISVIHIDRVLSSRGDGINLHPDIRIGRVHPLVDRVAKQVTIFRHKSEISSIGLKIPIGDHVLGVQVNVHLMIVQFAPVGRIVDDDLFGLAPVRQAIFTRSGISFRSKVEAKGKDQ